MQTTMKERPIVLSAWEVRAILAGELTQLRRPMHPQPEHVWGWGVKHDEHDFTAHVRYPGGHQPDPWVPCPYGAPPHRECPGDKLWVRETWADVHPLQVADGRYSQPGQAGIPGPPKVDYQTIYRADGEYPPIWHCQGHPYRALKTNDSIALEYWPNGVEFGWRSSPTMPRWASRLTLEITGISVERLQDITEEDAQASGVDREFRTVVMDPRGYPDYHIPLSCRAGFANVWERINGEKHPWSANPFVWAIRARRVGG